MRNLGSLIEVIFSALPPFVSPEVSVSNPCPVIAKYKKPRVAVFSEIY